MCSVSSLCGSELVIGMVWGGSVLLGMSQFLRLCRCGGGGVYRCGDLDKVGALLQFCKVAWAGIVVWGFRWLEGVK